jgi:hypothetical protein
VNISDIALKTVAFLGIVKDEKFFPRATCFFVQTIEDQYPFNLLVTAEHVVSGLLKLGHDIWLPTNLSNGKVCVGKVDSSSFRFHPNAAHEATDVAVCPIVLNIDDEKTGELIPIDVRPIPLAGDNSFQPSPEFCEHHIGRGSEVAILGLFRSHFGEGRNIPIVRVGNIAMLPEEPVKTRAGYLKAYLIETRSIAGLSGSPVLVIPNYAVELIGAMAKQETPRGPALLGLMNGHFDVPNLNEDVVTDDSPQQSIHTGIGVVIPVEKIVETINHPELVAERQKIVRNLRASGAAV